MRAVQVIAAEAQRQPVTESLSLVGTLAANEMVEIKSETEGTVAEVRFEEGQPVKKGDLLLRLDESKFAAALAEAEANFSLSQTTYQRSQQLLKDKLISQQEFEQAASMFQANKATVELRRRQLQDARIYAPFDGLVGARSVSPGQVIGKNSTLTWLVDLDPLKAEFNVPERFVSQLRIRQKIDLTVATYPGRTFAGEVYFIAPIVDPDYRTTLVKALVPNPKNELKPGMFANLDLTLRVRENAVVIPETAITRVLDNNQAMIYVISPTNTALLVPVQLGVRLAGAVEVVKGLNGGEQVIVEGVQKAVPGVPVRVANSPTNPPPPSARTGK